MNEFTKDELEELKTAVGWLQEVSPELKTSELEAKLQSLIDNYCAHETQPVFTTDGCVIPVCMECGKCTN